MKKLAIFISVFLVLPLIALADDAQLYGKVINKNGVVVEGSYKDITIPYNTIVEMSYYQDYDYAEGYLTVYYGGKEYYADSKDFIVDPLDNEDIMDDTTYDIIVVGNNTKLYSGPGLEFSVISKKAIPKGTVFSPQYSYYDEFAYVTYNGVSGWIPVDYYNIEDESYAKRIINDIGIIATGATIYNKVNGDSTGERLIDHSLVYIYYGFNNWQYVNYNGQDVWIKVEPDNVAYKKNYEKIIIPIELKTFDIYTRKNVTIPKNASVKLAYQGGLSRYAYYDSYLIPIGGNFPDSLIDEANQQEQTVETTDTNDRELLYFLIFIPVGALVVTSIYVFTKKAKKVK